ncbi:MAG: 50S ribosomal protein L18e [archaeon]
MKLRKSNTEVLSLIASLYKASEESSAPIWRDLAKRLEKPRQNWAEINLSNLNRVTKKGESVVIPGKLLGAGNIEHALTVYSYKVSDSASAKVTKAGGKVMPITAALKVKPKELRIIK